MANLERLPLPGKQDGYDIETKRPCMSLLLLHVNGCRFPNLTNFTEIDRFGGSAECTGISSSPYFNEHQRFPVFGDKIEFSRTASPVSGEHSQPGPLEKFRSKLFALSSQQFSRVFAYIPVHRGAPFRARWSVR